MASFRKDLPRPWTTWTTSLAFDRRSTVQCPTYLLPALNQPRKCQRLNGQDRPIYRFLLDLYLRILRELALVPGTEKALFRPFSLRIPSSARPSTRKETTTAPQTTALSFSSIKATEAIPTRGIKNRSHLRIRSAIAFRVSTVSEAQTRSNMCLQTVDLRSLRLLLLEQVGLGTCLTMNAGSSWRSGLASSRTCLRSRSETCLRCSTLGRLLTNLDHPPILLPFQAICDQVLHPCHRMRSTRSRLRLLP